MPLRRRVSEEVMERYAADQELAGRHRDIVAAATVAEEALRAAQAAGNPAAEVQDLAVALDKALTAAVAAAEAGERVAMGPRTYPPQGASGSAREGDENDAAVARDRRTAEIAARKSRARATVRPWTDEVDRLRTARETHRLTFRPIRSAGV